MDHFSTAALSSASQGTTASVSAHAACFEMKPFSTVKKGTKVSFLDVWGDPPIQSVKTSAKSANNEYISAVRKNPTGSGLRATLVNWGLLLE